MIFQKETRIPCSAAALFSWHEQPDAFQQLMPPGEPVKVLHHDGKITNGARAVLLVGYWPLCFRWELQHQDYIAGQQFCDVQIKGPFKIYRHEHVMTPDGDYACILSDTIYFEMPFGPIGRLVGRLIMMPKFRRLFKFRHEVTLRAFGINS